MSNPNLAYDQRLVCVGLRKMTKDTALIRGGFLYWNNTLAKQEFDVEKVVTILVDYLGVGVSEKKILMLTLHAASNKLFDELPPVPAVLLSMLKEGVDSSIIDKSDLENARENEAVVAAKSPHWIVTEQYLLHLTVYLGKHDREDLRELRNILMSEHIVELRGKTQKAIQQWAADGFAKVGLPEDIAEAECYQITHGVYMLMTEVIGPMESDKIVDRVIEDTLRLDAAARFSPRKLL
jgi:hypothetical protein